MKKIKLNNGMCATVDDDVFLEVSGFTWCTHEIGDRIYVRARLPGKKGANTNVSLHRFIMAASAGQIVDHINGDGLDNRMANLRLCSQRDNSRNRGPSKGRKTKGVSWSDRLKKWRAYIKVDYRQIYLGVYSAKVDALAAYDSAALLFFGEFARQNSAS